MPAYPDASPEALALAEAQARRLSRFRRALGLPLGDAAKMAGVGRFTWSRFESGDTRLDPVAIVRFCAANPRHPNLPSEYVFSGSVLGLPDKLARNLVRMEADEQVETQALVARLWAEAEAAAVAEAAWERGEAAGPPSPPLQHTAAPDADSPPTHPPGKPRPRNRKRGDRLRTARSLLAVVAA